MRPLLFSFLFCCTGVLYAQKNWKAHTERVGNDFTLTFKYPDSLAVESTPQGRCIGKQEKVPGEEDEYKNSMNWCILMGDEELPNMLEKSLAEEKQTLPADVVEKRNRIVVANKMALHITFSSPKTGLVLRELIYFKKYETMFQIVNNVPQNKGFPYFLTSIVIIDKPKNRFLPLK